MYTGVMIKNMPTPPKLTALQKRILEQRMRESTVSAEESRGMCHAEIDGYIKRMAAANDTTCHA